MTISRAVIEFANLARLLDNFWMRRKLFTTPPTVPAIKISVVHGTISYLARKAAVVIATTTRTIAMATCVAGLACARDLASSVIFIATIGVPGQSRQVIRRGKHKAQFVSLPKRDDSRLVLSNLV